MRGTAPGPGEAGVGELLLARFLHLEQPLIASSLLSTGRLENLVKLSEFRLVNFINSDQS